ncbi:Uncharacterised protein [Mycobacteroides abscessus subsp. abscessus]|nr:Uncharacterised protein [Mycobacteroides abscessus subsp. abscessus]
MFTDAVYSLEVIQISGHQTLQSVELLYQALDDGTRHCFYVSKETEAAGREGRIKVGPSKSNGLSDDGKIYDVFIVKFLKFLYCALYGAFVEFFAGEVIAQDDFCVGHFRAGEFFMLKSNEASAGTQFQNVEPHFD